MGLKNEGFWRIAVFDSRTRRDGRYLKNLGTYDPSQKKPDAMVKMDVQRYQHWVSKGALPSDSLARLLNHTGSVPKKK